jgi:hypothetical protein
MSASLADLADRLPAWRMHVQTGWQHDIRISHVPQLTIDSEGLRELTNTIAAAG